MWVACFTIGSATLTAAAQEPQRYNETVNVASVLIDVRVLDEAGRPIPTLNTSDFTVKISGRPTRVQSSAWIGADTASSPPVDHGAASSSAIREAPTGRLIIMLFQRSLANSHAAGLLRKLEESRDLVAGLGPSDRVAVLTFDTSLAIWTTRDAAR